MTAERDPMTLNESSVAALGVEERSDGPQGRARKPGATARKRSVVVSRAEREAPKSVGSK